MLCGPDCCASHALVTGPEPAGGANANNTFCANAWNSDDSGYQCLSVGDDQQSFAAMSHWTSDSTKVKSYPHVKLGSPQLPVSFQSIRNFNVMVEWELGLSSSRTGKQSDFAVDAASLTKTRTVANVALDIWADVDPHLASNEEEARIEIMVWPGVMGTVQPLEWGDGTSPWQATIGDDHFTLFQGSGPRGQNVLSWMPNTNKTLFDHDVTPLVRYLWENKLVPRDAHVGTVSLGMESFYSTDPITFSAHNLSLAINSGASSWKGQPGVGWSKILLGGAVAGLVGHVLL
ncbi:concanavalin A-like lectin/glucanase domain-containing protein [Immersiella caudata]|uniref:Concanavalin A-like lectin/glucanase domain-containing protein n=1 Tax=Immersiella caudata TaxID=314043 RepID=A0AA39TMV3_9PEZI|nr:concanavalin A-like lectin/glucanase domain-containing protein [Immersiella caudata]